jgi:YafQ family addiction module toxin component
MLATGVQLPPKYRDHPLRGKLNAFRECHIKDDWVLVYRFYDDVLVLSLSETGTHSDPSLVSGRLDPCLGSDPSYVRVLTKP